MLLPYVTEVIMVGNIKKFAHIAELMGENIAGLSQREAAKKAIESIKCLSTDINIPLHMREFNIPQDVLPQWAKMVIETQTRLMSNTARKLTEKDVLDIYQAAW